ncbi:MAG: hypothetical protein AB1432_15200 [Bacteroidota bacterium]
MKFGNYLTPTTIIYFLIFTSDLSVKLFFNYGVIYEFFHYLKNSDLLWGVSLCYFVPIGLLIFEQVRLKNYNKRQKLLFEASVRTIQDIVMNNLSKVQLVLYDLEDAKVPKEIINNTNEIFNSMKSIVEQIAKVNPLNSPTLQLRNGVHIFDWECK